jgi:hypothetical protein
MEILKWIKMIEGAAPLSQIAILPTAKKDVFYLT